MSKREKQTMICENCGEPCDKRRAYQRFCCAECRSDWHTATRRKMYDLARRYLAENSPEK